MQENRKASFSLTNRAFTFTHKKIFGEGIMGPTRGFLIVFFVLGISGCANQDATLRKQAELESRIETMAKGDAVSNQQIATLSNEVKDLQEKLSSQAQTLKELKDTVSDLRGITDNLLAQKQSGSAANRNQKIEVINKQDAGTEKSRGDVRSEAYIKAFGLYSANRYDEAIASFTAFIKAYPESDYAANAQYWIGECYYTQSNLPKALDAFKKVITTYPQGNKVPDAMLKAGYTLYALKQNESAQAMLESLIKRFPDSPAAVKAREKLPQNR
jgi:tol-pal system protein YbgF